MFSLTFRSIMDFILQPWQLYVVILAGWMNRQQQELIEYLRTENQVLKEKLGKKRILLNDDQRRRLAVKGKILGRKRRGEVGTLSTPDTILVRSLIHIGPCRRPLSWHLGGATKP